MSQSEVAGTRFFFCGEVRDRGTVDLGRLNEAAGVCGVRNTHSVEWRAHSKDQQLGRLVLNSTGLGSVFTFTLDYLADDAASTDSATGPRASTLCRKSLVSNRSLHGGLVDILVIDHAERPTAN
jgi:hypothetical protein